MANTMRWRYGDTHPVLMPVASSSTIEIGDLVCAINGQAVPATDLADQGTLAANQEAFHDSFLGVAMQCSADGDGEPIRVATAGVFEYACPSATYDVGDLLGPADDGGGLLQRQAIEAVTGANLAVGRCVRPVAPAGTRVLVDVVSTVVKGGPQVAA